MTSEIRAEGEWLTLGQASRRLGVHADTLRRWADQRLVPVWLTPGKHRRFSRASIDSFIRNTRNDPEVQKLVRGIDEDRRRAFRERGHQAARVLWRALEAADPADREAHLREADLLGRAYGREASVEGISLAAAIRIVMAVRGHFLSELHERSGRRNDPAMARAAATADRAFDRLLVALTAGYQLERTGSGATIEPTP